MRIIAASLRQAYLAEHYWRLEVEEGLEDDRKCFAAF